MASSFPSNNRFVLRSSLECNEAEKEISKTQSKTINTYLDYSVFNRIFFFSWCIHSLEEITEVVTEKGGGSLKIALISGERFAVYSTRCRQIYAMLNAFLREAGSIGKSRGVVCIVWTAIIVFSIRNAGKIDLWQMFLRPCQQKHALRWLN